MGFTIDHAGLDAVLKSPEVASRMNELAQSVAEQVRAEHPDADVVVDDYTIDRRDASVTIREPQARLWQARDGVLTRAVASMGLEVAEH